MSIFSRIGNLWRLSAVDVRQFGTFDKESGDVIRLFDAKPSSRASVVEMNNPLDIDLGNEE